MGPNELGLEYDDLGRYIDIYDYAYEGDDD